VCVVLPFFRYPQSTLAHGLRSSSQAFTRQSVWSILYASSWPIYTPSWEVVCCASALPVPPHQAAPALVTCHHLGVQY
jgi:hypothetical protein